MLTSEDVKFRLKVLIILASIALVLLIGGAVVMFISSYYGFTASSPIKCTTGAYFLTKYMVSNYYLSSSFAGMIFACLSMTFALILSIYYLVSLNELKNSEVE
jgi:ABC-type phosphate transport system permease subunit